MLRSRHLAANDPGQVRHGPPEAMIIEEKSKVFGGYRA
jgi:hypothetical protein